jgi:hypothetical protein
MSDPLIPHVVRQLIAERLDSIPELEAVLLLREGGPRGWTPEDAGRRLYVSTTVAAHILAALRERGFFASDGDEYRYHPESPALAEAVDALAAAYRSQLVAVTHLIHSKPGRNVRDFAEAFRLRPRS